MYGSSNLPYSDWTTTAGTRPAHGGELRQAAGFAETTTAMKRARWSRPQPLKIIATVRRIANRGLTCVRRVTPCMVNYLLIAAGYRYGASDTHTEFNS